MRGDGPSDPPEPVPVAECPSCGDLVMTQSRSEAASHLRECSRHRRLFGFSPVALAALCRRLGIDGDDRSRRTPGHDADNDGSGSDDTIDAFEFLRRSGAGRVPSRMNYRAFHEVGAGFEIDADDLVEELDEESRDRVEGWAERFRDRLRTQHRDGEETDPASLEDISGIGPVKADAMRRAGFETVEDVRCASRADLLAVEGIGRALALRIKNDVGDA